MGYLTGFDRSQAALFPVCMDDLIDQDSAVRFIDAFVDSLDLTELGFVEGKPSSDGRPAYHPGDLFKLYIYGYMNRIRTSRMLARECERNVELMWLLRGLKPCFRTIAGFRSENPQAFRKTFSHLVGRMNKMGLVGGKTVAIDSSKFRAVNSKKRNFNNLKIRRQLAYIDAKVAEYIKILDEEDLSEQQQQEIQEKIKKQKQRRKEYRQLQKKLQESGEEQISTTDPDSRSMILHGNVVEVAFNVQTAVDEKHKLIVSYEATNVNDSKALLKASLDAMEACGKDKINVLADKGYHNGEQIDSCTKEGIFTYVSPPDIPRSGDIPTPEFYGDKFIYNKRQDCYICPMGVKMETNGHWYNRHNEKSITRVKHYKTEACLTCPVRQKCTRNKNGRLMERSEYAESVLQNNQRVWNNMKKYLKRQEIIEHVFGTIKRQWGFDHILLKGLRKNDGEFGLIYLVYNIRRIINILGIKNLIKWLKSHFLLFLEEVNAFRIEFLKPKPILRNIIYITHPRGLWWGFLH